MANPNQIHLEGPNPDTLANVDISVNANVRDMTPAIDADESRIKEYDLLTKQIENGMYDGDGPADIVEVCQEEVCD